MHEVFKGWVVGDINQRVVAAPFRQLFEFKAPLPVGVPDGRSSGCGRGYSGPP